MSASGFFQAILPRARVVVLLALPVLALSCGKSSQPAGTEAEAAATVEKKTGPKQLKAKPVPSPKALKSKIDRGRLIARPDLKPDQIRRLSHYLERERAAREAATEVETAGEPSSALIGRFGKAEAPEERLDAVHEMTGRDDAEALDFLRQIAGRQDQDAEVRVAALEALAEHPRAEHLPIVAAVMESGDADLRAAAVWLLSQIPADTASPLWNQVMADDDPEITQLGFELLSESPEPVQVQVARQALGRNEPWITEQALLLLGGIVSKASVEALLPFVDHPVSGDLAQDGLFFLLGEHFQSNAEARDWWGKNRDRLDAELQPLELR